jgi:preprotein translocase subunit SecD
VKSEQGLSTILGIRARSLFPLHCSRLALFPLLATLACASGERAKAVDWRQVPVSIEMRLAHGAAGPDLISAPVYGQNKTVYVSSEPELSNAHVARVEAVKTRIGKGLILEVWLTSAGAKRIAAMTANHIGDSLAVLVNSVVVAVPIIRDTIDPGTRRSFDLGVPLEPEETGRLARAVSQTWRSR